MITALICVWILLAIVAAVYATKGAAGSLCAMISNAIYIVSLLNPATFYWLGISIGIIDIVGCVILHTQSTNSSTNFGIVLRVTTIIVTMAVICISL